MRIALLLLLSLALLSLQRSPSQGAYMPGDMVTPQQFGAVGNGTADDTAALQAAILSAQGKGKGLYLGPHRYKVTGELIVSQPLSVLGVWKRGRTYETSCRPGASTIVAAANTNVLTFGNGVNGEVEGVCFEMAATPGVRTSGWAIKSGEGQITVRGNSIIYPYIGISITGEIGVGQNNGSVVADNIIISPASAGIIVGANSQNAGTTGLALRNNQIACFATRDGVAGTSNAVGLLIKDAAVAADMTDAGPYGCDVGTKLAPGNNQTASGAFTGVLGDTSKTADLYIGPTASGGTVSGANFYQFWASSAAAGNVTDRPVWIENPAGGTIQKLVFSGGMIHSNYAQTSPAMTINGANGILVNGVQFTGNDPAGIVGPAVYIINSFDVNILSNFIHRDYQFGVQLAGGNNVISIIGNANLASGPFVVGTPPTTMSILSNSGSSRNCVDLNTTGGVTTYTLPNAFDCYKIGGAGDIWVMNGYWSAREVVIYAGVATTLHKNVPLNGLCRADLSLPAGHSVKLTYNGGDSCWMTN